MPAWQKGRSGNPAGGKRRYATDEEREAAHRASLTRANARWRARRAAANDPERAAALEAIAGRDPVSPFDPVDGKALVEVINTTPIAMLELGRLAERVALGVLIESLFDEKLEPRIKYANTRTLLQGWSAAPSKSVSLSIGIDHEKMTPEELIELGKAMFAPAVPLPAIDMTPSESAHGHKPSGQTAVSPLKAEP